MERSGIRFTALGCIVACFVVAPVAAEDADKGKGHVASVSKLDRAISRIRHIDQAKVPAERRHAMALEVQRAWETILAAGKPAAARLKLEVAAVNKAREKDDYFKLSAACLLWQLGKLDEAQSIADIWNTTPVEVQYMYTFMTAFQAAMTQDPRALPMLKAVLKDDKGEFFVPQHAMRLVWPQTHRLIWDSYGPKGLPILDKLLKTSKHAVQLRSAMLILAHSQYLPALSTIRKIARNQKGAVRGRAISCVGFFGHPDDYDFLIGQLELVDETQIWFVLVALDQYGDRRVVPKVIKYLTSRNKKVRDTAITCVWRLLRPDGLEALRRLGESDVTIFTDRIVGKWGLTWKAYTSKTPEEKAKLFERLNAEQRAFFQLKPTDRKITHADLVAACKEWQKRGRIKSGKYSWVEDRHVMAVARPEDITRLMEVRACVCRRLSDECLKETAILDRLILRIGRKRYREIPGSCDKVTPSRAPRPQGRTPPGPKKQPPAKVTVPGGGKQATSPAAAKMLRKADLYRHNKMPKQAAALYKEIVEKHPGTAEAAAAKKCLDAMGPVPKQR